ncbi:GNAT family N-acetyltransferase [Bacteroidota bacterium]
MELKSERLILKEITWDDLDKIHKLHSFPEVDEFNCLGIPKDTSETKEFIRPLIEEQKSDKRKKYFWKIITKDANEFVGIAGYGLSLDKFKLGEIYYKILPDKWGNGYATEAAKTLINVGFEKFNLHKVEAGVETTNMASINVLEKCGMTREGLRRKILPIRGEWKDSFHYAIVEDDPRDY